MYCSPNFKTKKQLKEAVRSGKEVTVFKWLIVSLNGQKVWLNYGHFKTILDKPFCRYCLKKDRNPKRKMFTFCSVELR